MYKGIIDCSPSVDILERRMIGNID